MLAMILVDLKMKNAVRDVRVEHLEQYEFSLPLFIFCPVTPFNFLLI
ncbi:MAG: hypothetical protein RLZZ175_2932 [Bacteroidota bacterium]|jgi:hypothetical protein